MHQSGGALSLSKFLLIMRLTISLEAYLTPGFHSFVPEKSQAKLRLNFLYVSTNKFDKLPTQFSEQKINFEDGVWYKRKLTFCGTLGLWRITFSLIILIQSGQKESENGFSSHLVTMFFYIFLHVGLSYVGNYDRESFSRQLMLGKQRADYTNDAPAWVETKQQTTVFSPISF